MSIMWKYLDKRSATIAAIKDYDAMQFILSSTGDEIKRTYEKMTGIGSPNYDGMPKADIIKERYRQAVEYMDWFKPAWEELTDEERYCLEAFYGDSNTYGSSAAYYVAEYLNIEQPTAYKRKNRALDRLTVLLFGKS